MLIAQGDVAIAMWRARLKPSAACRWFGEANSATVIMRSKTARRTQWRGIVDAGNQRVIGGGRHGIAIPGGAKINRSRT